MAETESVAAPPAVPEAARGETSGGRAMGQEGVLVNIVPYVLVLPMHQDRAAGGVGTRALQSPYHRVVPGRSALVSLRWAPGTASENIRPRLIRLTIQSETPGWRPGWAAWSWRQRVAPELRGGKALTAQDVLSGDGAALTLLLLPDEAREAWIEFDVPLVAGMRAGDYDFTVIAQDAETGSVADSVPARLRLDHPPSPMLQKLPAVWRDILEQESSELLPWRSDSRPIDMDTLAPYMERPFLMRWLRGFDDSWEPLQELMGQFAMLFAIETAPSDFLPWLASWLGVVLEDSWGEMRRRQIIREAVSLYRWRGTRRGLSRWLQIYTGVLPEITDQPIQGMRLGADALLGSRQTLLGNIEPHTFVLTIATTNPQEIREEVVRQIIETQKPAHTHYTLRILAAADQKPEATVRLDAAPPDKETI